MNKELDEALKPLPEPQKRGQEDKPEQPVKIPPQPGGGKDGNNE